MTQTATDSLTKAFALTNMTQTATDTLTSRDFRSYQHDSDSHRQSDLQRLFF
uniref:Uncharacterized protein n=1 Tax=Anguilla anguilla TaxID=7936 RepID=A0A0E9Q5D8_ANGAN